MSMLTLREFMYTYEQNANEWQRLDSGEHQDLFDQACAELEETRRKLREVTNQALFFARAQLYNCRCMTGVPHCEVCRRAQDFIREHLNKESTDEHADRQLPTP